jgi:hypothetical protein
MPLSVTQHAVPPPGFIGLSGRQRARGQRGAMILPINCRFIRAIRIRPGYFIAGPVPRVTSILAPRCAQH